MIVVTSHCRHSSEKKLSEAGVMQMTRHLTARMRSWQKPPSPSGCQEEAAQAQGPMPRAGMQAPPATVKPLLRSPNPPQSLRESCRQPGRCLGDMPDQAAGPASTDAQQTISPSKPIAAADAPADLAPSAAGPSLRGTQADSTPKSQGPGEVPAPQAQSTAAAGIPQSSVDAAEGPSQPPVVTSEMAGDAANGQTGASQPPQEAKPKPLDMQNFGSAAEVEALGLDVLKQQLQVHGLKCGGSLAERAARLLLLKDTPVAALDKKHFPKAKK